MRTGEIDHGHFEPTVFGAIRRYRVMVLIVTFLTAAAAVAYSLVQPEVFRASATVTVPLSAGAQSEARDQYFDSQVLLLQSQEVAERAARIAPSKSRCAAGWPGNESSGCARTGSTPKARICDARRPAGRPTTPRRWHWSIRSCPLRCMTAPPTVGGRPGGPVEGPGAGRAAAGREVAGPGA